MANNIDSRIVKLYRSLTKRSLETISQTEQFEFDNQRLGVIKVVAELYSCSNRKAKELLDDEISDLLKAEYLPKLTPDEKFVLRYLFSFIPESSNFTGIKYFCTLDDVDVNDIEEIFSLADKNILKVNNGFIYPLIDIKTLHELCDSSRKYNI